MTFSFKYKFEIKRIEFFRKTRLITREDLTIDWRIFYRWTQAIFYQNHDQNHGLIFLPQFVEYSHTRIE